MTFFSIAVPGRLPSRGRLKAAAGKADMKVWKREAARKTGNRDQSGHIQQSGMLGAARKKGA